MSIIPKLGVLLSRPFYQVLRVGKPISAQVEWLEKLHGSYWDLETTNPVQFKACIGCGHLLMLLSLCDLFLWGFNSRVQHMSCNVIAQLNNSFMLHQSRKLNAPVLFVNALSSSLHSLCVSWLTVGCGVCSVLASYGAFVKPMPFTNELGIQMLIGVVMWEASLQNIHPVFSHYSFHGTVFWVMLHVHPGQAQKSQCVDLNLLLILMHNYLAEGLLRCICFKQ